MEALKLSCAPLAGAEQRVIVAASLVSERQAGLVWNQLAPIDAESIAVAMSGEVGQAGNSKTALAAVSPRIVHRFREMATTENSTREVESTGLENRLEVGICP